MWYNLLADGILAVHFTYVAFVVVGELLILAGLLLRWSWVRNPWFRWLHLSAIAIVALESVTAFECPLTVWERDLRRMAGADVTEGATFIGQLMRDLLYFDVDFDHWGFPVAYVSFALLVLATLVLAPPRRRRKVALPAGGHGPQSAGTTGTVEAHMPPPQPRLSATTRSESTKS